MVGSSPWKHLGSCLDHRHHKHKEQSDEHNRLNVNLPLKGDVAMKGLNLILRVKVVNDREDHAQML